MKIGIKLLEEGPLFSMRNKSELKEMEKTLSENLKNVRAVLGFLNKHPELEVLINKLEGE